MVNMRNDDWENSEQYRKTGKQLTVTLIFVKEAGTEESTESVWFVW